MDNLKFVRLENGLAPTSRTVRFVGSDFDGSFVRYPALATFNEIMVLRRDDSIERSARLAEFSG